MQYVTDRLFEKVSQINLGDAAAAGTAAAGLGALAYTAPQIYAAVDGPLKELQEDARIDKVRYARDAGRQFARAAYGPASIRDAAAEAAEYFEFKAYDEALNEKALRGLRKGLRGLASTPVRLGVGGLAAALGTAGLYGALKD